MAEKTKLQLQIEASEKKIQEEQRRLKQLGRQQKEQDRKDRNHRLCKRHGYLESILPDIISLTEEQFQTFVKNHIANKHGIAAIANLMGQPTQSDTTATADTKPQNSGNSASKNTMQNATNPANMQGATA